MVSDHSGMMFTVLAMIDASAKIIGGLLMAALYSFEMDIRGRSGCAFSLLLKLSSSHIYNDFEEFYRFCLV